MDATVTGPFLNGQITVGKFTIYQNLSCHCRTGQIANGPISTKQMLPAAEIINCEIAIVKIAIGKILIGQIIMC